MLSYAFHGLHNHTLSQVDMPELTIPQLFGDSLNGRQISSSQSVVTSQQVSCDLVGDEESGFTKQDLLTRTPGVWPRSLCFL